MIRNKVSYSRDQGTRHEQISQEGVCDHGFKKGLTGWKTCVIFVSMKYTQAKMPTNTDYLVNLLEAQKFLEEKVRINLYLPRAVVKVMDDLSNNRSELATNLVVDKAKAKRITPYGMFKSKTSEKEIKEITSMWDRAVDEL